MSDDPWQVKVNAQYQDAMKTVLNLATASLALPLVLVKEFLGSPKCGHPGTSLDALAYTSWGLLGASILSCMAFFYASGKYVKVMYKAEEKPLVLRFFYNRAQSLKQLLGGQKMPPDPQNVFEFARDATILLSIVCFLAGLGCLLTFFRTLLLARN